MASDVSTATAPNGTDALLQSLVRGARGRALRAQLASRYPDCSADAIEEAIQYACKSFLDEAEGISAPGQVYAWIRTAAHRSLGREADLHHRELMVDSVEEGLEEISAEDHGPVDELIALEDDADLSMLVEEVSSSLSDRKRDVLALYGAGYKRPQIAERLGLTERAVKRDLLEIMDQARAILARLAGGGCDRGEPLVMRFVCGIASPDESEQAREHLSHCGRCELFSERLVAWREKAGAMLPAPVVEGASPGLLGRIAHASTERIAALKQQVLDGGAQVKQQATTTYRAVDPTPLAGARPGTVGAVIASCLAIGGGAATYCVQQGVDPIGAATGLIAAEPEGEPDPETAAPPEAESTGPEYTPAETPVEEAPAPEPTPEPAASEPKQEQQPQAEPPPPEDSFEPVSPSYTDSEAEPEAAYEPPPAEPAPVPANSSPQFGGP
ncbi:MAG: sigma-70 family RNA polymerase sigma factor [Solirubrobacterales bacterium]